MARRLIRADRGPRDDVLRTRGIENEGALGFKLRLRPAG